MKRKTLGFSTIVVLSLTGCGGGGNTTTKPINTEANRTASTQNNQSTLKQTEQTISYETYDDGYYQIGVPQSYQREGEIVTDTVIGLQWQDNNATIDGDTLLDWAEAKEYCPALTLGGYNDWRLPSIKELKSTIRYDKNYPAVDATFVNVASDVMNDYDLYWSSTTDASDSTIAWVVSSFYGSDEFYPKFNWAHVRCVRGTELEKAVLTRDENKGVVTDSRTEMIWQDDYRDNGVVVKKTSMREAIAYCETLILGDYRDWRLPNIVELYSIVDKSRTYPSIDPVFTEVVADDYYWSSTKEAPDEYERDGAWMIRFDFGDDMTWIDNGYISAEQYVRCVRGGI